MRVTLFPRARANLEQASYIDRTGSEFLDLMEQWPSRLCRNEAEKSNGEGYILASFDFGVQHKSIESVSENSFTELLVVDVDEITLPQLAHLLPYWANFDLFLHSTFKHRDNAPRLRALVRLAQPIPNKDNRTFLRSYIAACNLLQIPYDPNAKDCVRLFFGPQHQPGVEPFKLRFRGAPLVITPEALAAVPEIPTLTELGAVTTALNRPTRKEVETYAKRLKKSRNQEKRSSGLILEAILRGDAFAEDGKRHAAKLNATYRLVEEFGALDLEYFYDSFLAPSFTAVYGTEGAPEKAAAWFKMAASAPAAIIRNRSELKEQREKHVAVRPDLTEAQIERAGRLKNALVVSHRSAYFVYSPSEHCYRGPFKSAEVPTAFRQYLGGLPNVREFEYRNESSIPTLKSTPRLVHEYGSAVDAVTYHHSEPARIWDPETSTISVKAYRWIEWQPVYHQIADELLLRIGGTKYDRLEALLTRWTNLEQPLPALTLVGPRGVWKSRISSTLARFWTSETEPLPCRAQQVLDRFSGPLLQNPVIWSDEQLATSNGKPIPERYRESISERVHLVERKGMEPVSLHTATRHLISVNDGAKVFSTEVDVHSVDATIERYLVLNIDGDSIADFEQRWKGRPELDRLRSGESLLEHVRWLIVNRAHLHKPHGRLFVNTGGDKRVLMKARFADDLLQYCIMLCLDRLDAESQIRIDRPIPWENLPMIVDEQGKVRISPSRIADVWGRSDMTKGIGLAKPSPTAIGRVLVAADFKLNKDEEARKNKHKAWCVKQTTLKNFLDASEIYSWEEFVNFSQIIFKRLPTG